MITEKSGAFSLKKWLLIGLVAVALAWMASPAQCAAADYYAAIAFSPSTGACGYSYGFTSLTAAKNRAVEECEGADAVVVGWARNAYVALALGDDRGACGVGWASTAASARAMALANCRARTTGCYIAGTVFSGR
jgi:serine/threonine-protein kinase